MKGFSLALPLPRGYNHAMPEYEPDYQAALDFLYSFIDYSLTRNLRNAPEKFDLARVEALLEALGDPHRAYPVLHIAGTKGKGSTAALMAAALQAQGYTVGLYTSPHLEDFAERIQVNGRPMPHADLPRVVARLEPCIARIPGLTTFELITAAAFLYFAERAVDVAVVEVGLGGRLDATNVVHPLVSVITPISYDHTAILGNTLEAIAGEKAGIIKPGVPVVMAPQPPEARQRIAAVAAEREAPLIEVGRDWLYAPVARSLEGQVLFVWHKAEQPLVDAFVESGGFQEWEPTRLRISLLGPHQVINAATAYAALQTARRQGLALSPEAIRRGFAAARWPGRFEVLHRNPPLVVDGAHNRAAAHQIRLTLDEYFPGWPLVLVFGASADKDIRGMLEELVPRARRVIVTRSHHPRAADPEDLRAQVHQLGRAAQAFADVEDALQAAFRAAAGEAVVLVTGSLFVAAAARSVWHAAHLASSHWQPLSLHRISAPSGGL
ncbi:MAG TPA: bifunctional folylpolyglutamate synthase/dihydrofolate synthase [Chloroflexi bacterium]|nr:bifunctional folylpolyglutamate synthase/dihydrofolate synthase [Chloroflexota bacterium]